MLVVQFVQLKLVINANINDNTLIKSRMFMTNKNFFFQKYIFMFYALTKTSIIINLKPYIVNVLFM